MKTGGVAPERNHTPRRAPQSNPAYTPTARSHASLQLPVEASPAPGDHGLRPKTPRRQGEIERCVQQGQATENNAESIERISPTHRGRTTGGESDTALPLPPPPPPARPPPTDPAFGEEQERASERARETLPGGVGPFAWYPPATVATDRVGHPPPARPQSTIANVGNPDMRIRSKPRLT